MLLNTINLSFIWYMSCFYWPSYNKKLNFYLSTLCCAILQHAQKIAHGHRTCYTLTKQKKMLWSAVQGNRVRIKIFNFNLLLIIDNKKHYEMLSLQL